MQNFLAAISLLFFFTNAFAQGELKGIVTDASTDDGLAFANISLLLPDGKLLGTSTDQSGHFSLTLDKGTYGIDISYLGYTTQRFEQIQINDHTTTFLNANLERSDLGTDCIVQVIANRPFAIQNIYKKELDKNNLGQDVPYVLKMTPSAVVTSDAGTGIGYSAIRVRGMDQTNINVTVNNIPLNDPESHQVYWVDLPDIMASANNLEIQRGVGSSTNGAGAFGATINVATELPNEGATATLASTIGSFNTQKYSLEASTGKLKSNLSFLGRVSTIQSDGYVDRASSDLVSYFLSGNYKKGKNQFQFNTFSGHEITYQAWYGIPKSYVDDPKLRTYNPAGLNRPDQPHPDQVDNYKQTHYQAIYTGRFDQVTLHAALHYTKGIGYYESYKDDVGKHLADYNLDQFWFYDSIPAGLDVIRRKWLDNDFYGTTLSLNKRYSKLNLIAGGGWNQYLGAHYGTLPWVENLPAPKGLEFYRNNATKTDFNVFAKAIQSYNNWRIFGDVQYRKVDYAFVGKNVDGEKLPATVHHNFFNPKFGVSYLLPKGKFFASFATAHREPNRADYKDSSPESRPKSEQLLDFEAGYTHHQDDLQFELNGYFMSYQDQLVSSGKLNDVGEYVRVNIPQSYRTGLEGQVIWPIKKQFQLSSSITVSQNKIKAFTEYIDNWDTWGQEAIEHQNTNLAFSPNVIGALSFDVFTRDKSLQLSFANKYVGKQYLDNTSNDFTSLPAYFYNDLQLSYFKRFKKIDYNFNLKVNNLFNQKYSTNGWAYRYQTDNPYMGPYDQQEAGNRYSQVGLYPQAGINYLLGVTMTFY